MPRYIWDKELEQMIPAEEYYFNKYMKLGDKQGMIGNKPVTMNYISDQMEPTRHMCDGKYYTSKAKFREVTKAHGCVEVGNDTKQLTQRRKPVKLDRRKRREDIRKAIHDVKNGNAPRIDQLC